MVDEALDRLGLVGAPGPDGRTYVDVPDAPAGRDLPGVRLLPEFDALMCGYDPSARDRFAEPDHLRRLWNQSNGMVLPPLLVDGRITGHWRAGGSAKRRPLDIVWFAGTRRPDQSELAATVTSLEAALDITITGVTLTREQA
ncbi:DNA glycosylase AlkZ-like family protein [Nocardioides sp.]|uniref:DNA glycosylase AlkZ-like family protein n=1 Tax=Nocardioides sp. TaxID=35761 RepID=UPI002D163C9E|nr:crosslink repair DNA glycosylase YcaQ family protein [Nocardioides sp.]HXH78326.1 crosslink repair DNA glycosylase YcaQ family protein [Nocardioides sp.]